MSSILIDKTLRKSMIDLKNDEKEGEELQKIYIYYLDKCKDTIKSTEITYHGIFGDILGK